MLVVCQALIAALILAFVAGSLLGLLRSSHWFIRGWEYPRIQIASFLAALIVAYAAIDLLAFEWTLRDTLLAAVTVVVIIWHLARVFAFTPLAPNQVVEDSPTKGGTAETVRVITSNVEMENTDYDAFIAMVRRERPDVLIVLETDQGWVDALQPLAEEFAHHVAIPQDNWYGMVLMTNLELVEHDVRYIVQEDIPSIHALLRLKCGGTFRMRCLHPRPPEPIRGTHSTSRDAELVIVGREIEDADEPTIAAGDLNDVAWSHTTRLFLRLSRMLDPRRGRGLYRTWPVDHPFWAVPLDHVFHSEDFTYKDLRVLEDIGSDHFPVCADLVWRTTAELHQEPDRPIDDDEEEAQRKIEEAEEENGRRIRSDQREMPADALAAPEQSAAEAAA